MCIPLRHLGSSGVCPISRSNQGKNMENIVITLACVMPRYQRNLDTQKRSMFSTNITDRRYLMNNEIAMIVSGAFFWIIIITNFASNALGYQTAGELDTEAQLHEISNAPGKFRLSFVIIVIEHISIVVLAFSLFLAFNQLNIMLAIIWLIARSLEGLMQIVNKKNYWQLLELSTRFVNAQDTEKDALDNQRMSILKSKHANFTLAQILFSIGTLSYTIVFATYDVIPATIAGLGIVASLIYGAGNVLAVMKRESKALWAVGGLLILIFEVLAGGWLIYLAIT